jgi:transcriptional regulator with XRE-family HTH domain
MPDISFYRKRLREIRDENLLTVREMADEIGVSIQLIYQVLDDESKRTFSFMSLRKFKAFIDKHSKES